VEEIDGFLLDEVLHLVEELDGFLLDEVLHLVEELDGFLLDEVLRLVEEELKIDDLFAEDVFVVHVVDFGTFLFITVGQASTVPVLKICQTRILIRIFRDWYLRKTYSVSVTLTINGSAVTVTGGRIGSVVDEVVIAVMVTVVGVEVVKLTVLVRVAVVVMVAVEIWRSDEQNEEALDSLCNAETTRPTTLHCAPLRS
jgi:hypothetical protein